MTATGIAPVNRRTSLYTATFDTPDLEQVVARATIAGFTIQDSRPDQGRSVLGCRFPSDAVAAESFARIGFLVAGIVTGLGVHRREIQP